MKTEQSRRIFLSKSEITNASLSPSSNFRVWDENANNGIALLTLGWSYILSAALAERQTISMAYCQASPSSSPWTVLDLDYASSKEKRWWKAIVAYGVGWSMVSHGSPCKDHVPHNCRAAVARPGDMRCLRHDCSHLYPDDGFSHTPPFGWPPFGQIRALHQYVTSR